MSSIARRPAGFHSALLGVACLAGSLQAFAADCDKAPFSTARQAILAQYAGEEPTFSSCEPVPGSPDSVAAMFAYERPSNMEDVKVFDVELLLADARSGAVQARLTRRKVWESDAYKIDSAAISDAAYPLRAGTTIFGLVENWSASSRVSFYNISKLSLYERRGKTLVPLMADFVTDIYQGEGCDVQTTRELRVEPAKGKGYAGLRVLEKTSGIARDEQSCPAVDDESDKTVIRHVGGKYPVPKRMQPFDGD